RGYLRFFPAASVQDVAAFLDAPDKDVRARWPEDAVRVDVPNEAAGGDRRAGRWAIADGTERHTGADERVRAARGGDGAPVVRLIGPYALALQLPDRPTLVPDDATATDLWRVLGRRGAVLADDEVVGTWRPRTSGRRLTA